MRLFSVFALTLIAILLVPVANFSQGGQTATDGEFPRRSRWSVSVPG